MDSKARRPGWTRWAAVCALLLGLFLMHGAPSAALGGCHDATSAAMPVSHPVAAMMAHTKTAAAHPGGSLHVAAAGMGGALCVSTPAHDRVPLGAVGLLAIGVAVVWGLVGRHAVADTARWRGPPRSGRGLLLRVCIART